MGKFNKKVKGKKKKHLKELQKEFNPSARDPYIDSEQKEKEKMLEGYEEYSKAIKELAKHLQEIEEEEQSKEE